MKNHVQAFTLVELMVVVATLSVLAAAALPSFLDAQTHAKVSAAKADMRAYGVALEAYYADNQTYIPCSTFLIPGRGPSVAAKPVFEHLSTPIAYLEAGIVPSPFGADRRTSNADAQSAAESPTYTALSVNELHDLAYRSYFYQSGNESGRTAFSGSNGTASPPPNGSMLSTVWFLHSPGPTRSYLSLGGILANSSRSTGQPNSNLDQCIKLIYDPSNGTISSGVIWRVGGQTDGEYGYYLSGAALAGN